MASNNNSERIVKNTFALYVRMIFLMIATLYTSRVVLNALGIVDYGIYTAVGGFVATFAIISNSLTAAISRYITFELGKGDISRIGEIFSTSILMQISISIIVLLVSLSFGFWFVEHKMIIPQGSLYAAKWVFLLSVVTFVINLISVPYNACIIAHERMGVFAYIGIGDALGRLLIAFLIKYASTNRLIAYAVLMCLLAVLIRCIYGWYCKRNFPECKLSFRFNFSLIKEMFGFAGWNFIGASSGVLRDHGVNVLLNIYCGPVVNAARGIAMQVNAAVTQFSSNFLTAINPQITKSYASADRDYWIKLVFNGARYSFYLLLLIIVPVMSETNTILRIWLGIVPEYTTIFVRLILICVLTESISTTMTTLMLATGNIRNYQILVGGCQMLNFPISYILLKIGLAPQYTILTAIIIATICLLLRLFMLRKMVAFPVLDFIVKVVGNVISVLCISIIFPLIVTQILDEGFVRLLVNIIVSVSSVAIIVGFVGMSKSERQFIIDKIKTYNLKFKNENQ